MNDVLYYIKGGNGNEFVEYNKELAINAFGEENCEEDLYFKCVNEFFAVNIYENGFVSIEDETPNNYYYCLLDEIGGSLCFND